MPASYIIALFMFGMMVIAFTAIVVETWWVVAIVGITHLVGSVVLMLLVIRALSNEERDTARAEREADARR